MLWLLGIVASLVLLAAYGTSDGMVRTLVSHLADATGRDLVATAASRFPHYPNPPGAILGIGMAWLTAPITAYAGWLFTARAIAGHIAATHRHRSRANKLAFAAIMIGIAAMTVFATIFLPGGGTVRCPECEDRSMLFMLAIRVAGFYATGGIAGAAWLLAAEGIRGDAHDGARTDG
jgi:hypothetical protein